MTRGVYEKFRQNEHLLDLLLTTNKNIYEASPDRLWGTGVHIKNVNALSSSNWQGVGLMHQIYSKVKGELSTT